MRRPKILLVLGLWVGLLGCHREAEPSASRVRPTVASPADAKPADAKPADAKPADGRPVGVDQVGAKSTEAGPAPSPHALLEGQGEAKTIRQDNGQEYRLPAVPHWIAIGDLHGDFEATRAVFRLAGATDDKDRWRGGELVVIQTGDQLDRGDGERQILEFLDRVTLEAERAHGKLIVLNGNHETMNALGDFRYVTELALHAFDDLSPSSPLAARYPGPIEGRARAFLPGGAMAIRLAKRKVVVQVGDTVFAHAGVRAPHLDYGLDRLNRETSEWLLGKAAAPPRLVVDEEGPVWTRVYGSPELSSESCAVLERALARLGAQRMVVGHTVQKSISSGCAGKIIRIDVGMSAYYGGAQVMALEYKNGELRPLVGPR